MNPAYSSILDANFMYDMTASTDDEIDAPAEELRVRHGRTRPYRPCTNVQPTFVTL